MELSKADALLKEAYEKRKRTRKELNKDAIKRRLDKKIVSKRGTP